MPKQKECAEFPLVDNAVEVCSNGLDADVRDAFSPIHEKMESDSEDFEPDEIVTSASPPHLTAMNQPAPVSVVPMVVEGMAMLVVRKFPDKPLTADERKALDEALRGLESHYNISISGPIALWGNLIVVAAGIAIPRLASMFVEDSEKGANKNDSVKSRGAGVRENNETRHSLEKILGTEA